MAHAGGRPSKYDPAFIKVIEEYLKTVGRNQTKLPKRVDIALEIGVDVETLINWGKEHREFFDALTRVDESQLAQLMDDGFYGGKEVNPRMAQFLLSANHGLKEKSDITSDDKAIAGPTVFIPKETDG